MSAQQAHTHDTLPRYSARCLWPAECQLGEGPLWLAEAGSASAGRLLWLDIHGAAVHGLDLPSGQRHRWALPWRVAWLIASSEAEQGIFLAGRVDAVLRLRLWPQLEVLGPGLPIHPRLPQGQGMRLNDAKLDPWGRVWFSGIYEPDPSQPRAELLRLDGRGQLQAMEGGYRIGNGPCFSLDGRTLWHADSGLGCVWAYALDEQGEPQGAQPDAQQGMAPRRLWRQFPPEEGVPDGMCVDAEGALWIAHWGGHRVTRYSPQGQPLARIDLPVSQVTSCCFGGVDGRQLFITSARSGLSEAQLAREPLAGGLFVADLPVAGAPLGRFAFDAAALRAGMPWA